MKTFFFHYYLLISIFDVLILCSNINKNSFETIKIEKDRVFAENMRNLLQLNITYNESKEAFELLQNLKSSYQNYSEQIKNISDSDYQLCVSELNASNCSFKDFWRDEIIRMQRENDYFTDLLKNNITNERKYICTNFTDLRKKIIEENKIYNDSLDVFFAHLIGVKKVMQILKNFYNLTILSNLFIQFENNVRSHQTSLISQTANEIKKVVEDIREKIEEKNIFHVLKTHEKKSKIKERKNFNMKEKLQSFNFTGKDVQIILKVYNTLNSLLDLMQNTTIYLTNYHNAILYYYDQELEDLTKYENSTEFKFNQTFNAISDNTLQIKTYEVQINVCIGKATNQADCDVINKKAEELQNEVKEFLKIIDEILSEFK